MDSQPFTKYTPDEVASQANIDIAFQAALESIVLLQNDGTLPLNKKPNTIALLGPHMNSTKSLQANYHGAAPFLISPLMGMTNNFIHTDLGLQQILPDSLILAANGSLISGNDESGFAEAVSYALKSDIIVLCFGIDESIVFYCPFKLIYIRKEKILTELISLFLRFKLNYLTLLSLR